MIEIKFTADTVEQLREQMFQLIGAGAGIHMPVVDVRPYEGGDERYERYEQDKGPPEKDVPPFEPPVKPKRKHRATRAPVAAPAPVEVDETETLDEIFDDYEAETVKAGVDTATRVLDHEKLKNDTLALLPDMFAAGQVKVIRHVLGKYGNGAKSFPEIDASQFPAIAAALKAGEAA